MPFRRWWGTAGRWLLAGLVSLLLPSVRPASAQTSPWNSIGLEWTAPGDDGNVGRAYQYRIRFSTNAVGADTAAWWNAATAAAGLPAPSPAGQVDSARVAGLQSGTTYYFLVRAVDDAYNESGFSNVAVGATWVCDAPSGAPTGFAAVEDTTTGDAVLSWDPATDARATLLHIYRGLGSSGPLTLLTSLNASQVQFRDASVNPGTTYHYRAAWAATCGDGPQTTDLAISLSGTPPPGGTASASPTIRAYPNPSSGPVEFVLTVPGASTLRVRVRLFDMSGHWVADILEGDYGPGVSRVTWDREARGGGRLSPGYYEAIGTAGSSRVRERLVLLP